MQVRVKAIVPHTNSRGEAFEKAIGDEYQVSRAEADMLIAGELVEEVSDEGEGKGPEGTGSGAGRTAKGDRA